VAVLVAASVAADSVAEVSVGAASADAVERVNVGGTSCVDSRAAAVTAGWD